MFAYYSNHLVAQLDCDGDYRLLIQQITTTIPGFLLMFSDLAGYNYRKRSIQYI